MNISMSNGNNPSYAAIYDDLIQEVFHFSFGPWVARNLWDERYESYSIIENGKMLSNVSIYKTDMIVHGQPIRAHQFGAVATRKSERGKGLSGLLMNYVLNKYPNIPAFLGANDTVTKFYPRFGFRPIQTYRPIINVAINNLNLKLKCHPDDDAVQKALKSKRVYSNVLDSINTQPVQMCQMLTNPRYKDHIYFLPVCNAIIIAMQKNSTLYLSDVISSEPICFSRLKFQLPFTGITQVEFDFNPDWLDVCSTSQWPRENYPPRWEPLDEPYFIRGEWNLPKHFRFPALSET